MSAYAYDTSDDEGEHISGAQTSDGEECSSGEDSGSDEPDTDDDEPLSDDDEEEDVCIMQDDRKRPNENEEESTKDEDGASRFTLKKKKSASPNHTTRRVSIDTCLLNELLDDSPSVSSLRERHRFASRDKISSRKVHDRAVTSITLCAVRPNARNPDKVRFVTTGEDGRAVLMEFDEIKTKKIGTLVDASTTGQIASVVPLNNFAKQVAVCSSDGCATVFECGSSGEIKSSKPLMFLGSGKGSRVVATDISCDRKVILAVHDDGEASVTDAQTGEHIIRSFSSEHRSPATCVYFFKADRRACIGHEDGTSIVWSLMDRWIRDNTVHPVYIPSRNGHANRPFVFSNEGRCSAVRCMTTNATDTILFVGSDDGMVCARNTSTGAMVRQFQAAKTSAIVAIDVIERKLLVTASASGHVTLWDDENIVTKVYSVGETTALGVSSLLVHRGRLICGRVDGTIVTFDMKEGEARRRSKSDATRKSWERHAALAMARYLARPSDDARTGIYNGYKGIIASIVKGYLGPRPS